MNFDQIKTFFSLSKYTSIDVIKLFGRHITFTEKNTQTFGITLKSPKNVR